MTCKIPPIVDKQGPDDEMIEGLKRETFSYFLEQSDPHTGLVADSTSPHSPSSIAATGLALNTYIVGVERDLISRSEARDRTLRVLRFFKKSKQGKGSDCTGYKGFYYHFLNMKTGEREWKSELSTIDTALFCASILASAQYFDGPDLQESEIRHTSRFLYERVDWKWACNRRSTLTHGWNPESGFLPYRWNKNYSEALILYVLALGSPTFPISEKGYHDWTSTFRLSHHYGFEYLHAGPLFIHQLSQIWIDCRNIHDSFNRKVGFDYFENSVRATRIQQQYAIDNPKGFNCYGENFWGLTASAGPGPALLTLDGKERVFYDYIARGAPADIDDGTVSPWAVITSLPFAPEIVCKSIRHSIERFNLKSKKKRYGLDASFNPTFPSNTANPHGWISPYQYGLNQGPLILMIENFQSGLIWKLMRQCHPIGDGLFRAGFRDALS